MNRRILITAGLSLALLLCLSGTYARATPPPPTGQKLVGTWEVTLRFPAGGACSPGGVANITFPALHTYSSDGTMAEVSGGSPFRGDALGVWEHLRDQEYAARYKFFIFNPAGARTATEVVTSRIELQGHDAFEATATFDLFAADGVTPIPESQDCPIIITGTRF